LYKLDETSVHINQIIAPYHSFDLY